MDYEIGARIGGDVYHAAGPNGRAVALKRLPAAEPAIRAARAIDHRHLVRVIDDGRDADGPWIAMPFVDAMTLRDPFTPPLSARAALVLLHPVLEGLTAMHAAGLVHGDVRPENILLTPTGDVTIVDPGLGHVRSRRLYHPPEHFEGRELDPGADVWSVGVVLYELLSGRLPFESEAAIREGKLEPLEGELGWVVSICLAPNAWARPLDARALLTRLAPLIPCALDRLREERMALLADPAGYDRRPIPPAPPRPLPPPPAPEPRRLAIWPFALGALALVAAVLIALAILDDDPPPRVIERIEARPARAPIIPLRLSSIPNNLPLDTSGLSSYGAPARTPGLIAIRRARYELAEEIFTHAIASDPDDTEARLHRGVLRHRLGRARDAYGDLTEVLEAEPDNTAALEELVQVYAAAGHVRQAEPLLRRLVAIEPRDVDAWVDLSIALGPSGEGIRAIVRAVELEPEHVRARREHCLAFVRARREDAVESCTAAIERAPDEAALYLARARARSIAGDHGRAIEDADRAIALSPTAADAFFERSQMRRLAADDGGAFRDLSASCHMGHPLACAEMRRRGVTP